MNEHQYDPPFRRHVLVQAFELGTVDPGLQGWLDAAEQARADTILDAPTRRDFIAGRVVQRIMAAELLDAAPGELVSAYSCPECGPNPYPSHGRPGYLLRGEPAAVSVSFSRSHGWAVAAMVPFAGVGIGVDVQQLASVAFDGFDDVALSSAEKLRLSQIAPGGQDAWRAAAWARKEALAKVSGLGLRTDPTRIEAFPGNENGKQGPAAQVWDVESARVGLPEGFAAAVAVGAKT
ncbi:4'-phosphopantetheinyl transferase [Arthrobacter alpinus]|uniref:4'-phosphopantetheinyl transferase n=1 Tax=Arthrobacter alpinus TaxID=656366 RepID=A0A1H5JQR0_9MICC|nr:4'-phosphopantetheinyl transferase superfamily protein [Arthrobacter alpinus]SEE54925.1 4'-phosphopantetheinyl transferase [Arthrobacter alpinus]